jgi:hypothetical protein
VLVLATVVGAAAATPGPTFVVTPTDDLVDGQQVHVTGQGYAPNPPVLVLQCAAAVASNADGDTDHTVRLAWRP